MRGIQPTTANSEDRGREPQTKEHGQSLKAENHHPCSAASKKIIVLFYAIKFVVV